MSTCYRHPAIETGLSCVDCERPVCGRCAVSGVVGQVCPDCSKSRGAQVMVNARAASGQAVTLGPARATVSVMAVLAATSLVALSGYGAWLWDWTARSGIGLADGRWWTTVALVLVHGGGLIHLGFNLWGLWLLGPLLEQRFGPGPLVGLLLASAAGGSLAFMLLGDPTAVVGGASGAVFGLLGAWLAQGPAGRGTVQGAALFARVRAWAVISMVVPVVVPAVSWQDHIGGFIAGFLLARVWLTRSSLSPAREVASALVLAIALVAASVAVALVQV